MGLDKPSVFESLKFYCIARPLTVISLLPGALRGLCSVTDLLGRALFCDL